MAKEQSSQPKAVDPKPSIDDLAFQLYQRFWHPENKQSSDQALAAFCFQGAQAFGKVASQIGEGRRPEEILGIEIQIIPAADRSVAS